MDPDTRTGLIALGLFFCVLFAGLTLAAAAESGFNALTAVSLIIVGMILIGLIGAIRNPPRR